MKNILKLRGIKITMLEAILVLLILGGLFVIHEQREIITTQQDLIELQEITQFTYQIRIHKMDSIYRRIDKEMFLFTGITNKLSTEYEFLTHANPKEILGRYYVNEENMGGEN